MDDITVGICVSELFWILQRFRIGGKAQHLGNGLRHRRMHGILIDRRHVRNANIATQATWKVLNTAENCPSSITD